MPDKLNFSFPVSLLSQEADLILNAGDKYTAQISPRLQPNFLAGTRTLAGQVALLGTEQKSKAGDLGTLTADQNRKFAALLEKVGAARDTAKRAFKGQDVKLREEFQVGINKPDDLGSVLQRARIILASVRKPANATTLGTKGWLDDDDEALELAIEALDDTDETQEAAKTTKASSTGDRNAKANELYEALLTVQNAANLQWPESNGANATIRAEFRLGKFPPRNSGNSEEKKKNKPTPPTPPA
ncbi:MAG: hypothetical protein EPO07_02590 [Verrucomicrobia bacterium]|nr:MAG: hypothetical protein EPO07_02590 [Verrucomicrobiota bacterium]